MSNYNNIICIHPYDETTTALGPIGELFSESYYKISPTDQAHEEVIRILDSLSERSLVIFLGHGTQSGLYGSDHGDYKRKLFINAQHSSLFRNHDIFLLSCFSADFIKKSNEYNCGIGFGNIISSMEERSVEAEMTTGVYRNINEDNISFLNDCYLKSTLKALTLLKNGKILFTEVHHYIRYFINKEISYVLLDPKIENRRETAKLLFEFRNDMQIIRS